ncbi:hypothetical protein BGX29_010800 [Mortierella sp. GBA35]|nr:hypothetical protein BGX29_010800 [Mortierella sp. GBA35]
MLHHQRGSSVQVTIHSAEELLDFNGKKDIYVNVSVEVDNDEAYRRSRVTRAKGGSDPVWEETVLLDFRGVSSDGDDSNLYVEVLEKTHSADRPIGFTAIPLGLVPNERNQTLSGRFDLYGEGGDDDAQGKIVLTIQILPSGSRSGRKVIYDGGFPKEYSLVDSEQQGRFNRLCTKA